MAVGTIPTIDLEDMDSKLIRASEEWGCFRIINHNIPLELMAEMKSVVRSLFDLPLEIKQRNTDVFGGSGYMAPSMINPLFESLGLYDPASSQAVNDFCAQLDASPHQREVIKAYTKAIHKLAISIGRKLVEGLGLRDEILDGWPCLFRINKYNFSPETVGSTGAVLHSDPGFLTIVHDDEKVGGLEAMDKLTDSFVAIDPLPGSFVVNLGDTAKAWSNGRFHNVKHRVQCNEATIRVSISAFFLGPKEGLVEAPPELVDSEHSRLYVPFSYEDYRKLRISTKMPTGGALELLRNIS